MLERDEHHMGKLFAMTLFIAPNSVAALSTHRTLQVGKIFSISIPAALGFFIEVPFHLCPKGQVSRRSSDSAFHRSSPI